MSIKWKIILFCRSCRAAVMFVFDGWGCQLSFFHETEKENQNRMNTKEERNQLLVFLEIGGYYEVLMARVMGRMSYPSIHIRCNFNQNISDIEKRKSDFKILGWKIDTYQRGI